ncbi:hypothetical protein [Parafrankia soli]|uniref:hypothetical protein n=1 Tax=Parafrankia soli TaxID=2599596 RepID=UPI000B321B01
MNHPDEEVRYPPTRLLGLLMAPGLAFTACSSSSSSSSDDADGGETTAAPDQTVNGAPGVTQDEIRFSVLGTKTNNPTGSCMLDCFSRGIKACFAFRNSTGGVHGRRLTVTTEIDDALGQNQQGALQIITKNDTFADFGAAQLPACWGDLAKAGVPQYVWAIQPQAMAGQDSIFGNAGVTCLECTNRTFTYAAELAGAKKIGALGYGVSESSKRCASTITDAIELYHDQTDQEVVYKNDDLAFGLPNGIGPEAPR